VVQIPDKALGIFDKALTPKACNGEIEDLIITNP
jgi:hypothetical protein